MFFSVLILLLILPVMFLSLALEDFFSSDELAEMGVIYPQHQARSSKSLRRPNAVV